MIHYKLTPTNSKTNRRPPRRIITGVSIVVIAVQCLSFSKFLIPPIPQRVAKNQQQKAPVATTTTARSDSTICPAVVTSSRFGAPANLTDDAFFREYFWYQGLENAIFWYERPGWPRKMMKRFHDAWFWSSIYDSNNKYRHSMRGRGFELQHWINQSYILASAARYLNLTIFLLAIDVTEQVIEEYHQFESLSISNSTKPPIADVFCAVEYQVLRDRDIYVINTHELAAFCLRTSPESCKRRIQSRQSQPGFIGVKQMCGHIDKKEIEQHPLHPRYWCPKD